MPGDAARVDRPASDAAPPAAARRAPGAALTADDDARAAARVVLRTYLDAFAREEAAARTGDVEAVHRLHVATRRLRGALRLFGSLLPSALVEMAVDGFTWIGREIGAVRDLDVLALAVAACGRTLDEPSRDALAPLQRTIAARRAGALASLVAQLDSARTRRLLARLAALADGRPPVRGAVALGDVARGLLRPMLRGVRRAAKGLEPDAPAPALHRLRVRAKELRYACETLRPLSAGDDLDRVVRRLVRLQDVLGEHHDAVTQAAWLRAAAGTEPLPAETLLAMGAVVHALGRRARKRRTRFARAWRRLDRPRTRRAVIDGMARPTRRTAT